ncbi:MAG: hypothetical protein ABIL44_00965 [candidate division WOR-3 bacterium]
MKGLIEVKVDSLPVCDFCKKRPAKYDGRTNLGPWAYMCKTCFKVYGVGIGLGKGQKLVLKIDNSNEVKKENL